MIGERLGLYRAMAGRAADAGRAGASAPGPPSATCASGCGNQAAGGYVDYDAEADTFDAARRSRRWRSPTRTARSTARRLPVDRVALRGRGRRSPRRSAPARASAGTSTTTGCSRHRAVLPPRLRAHLVGEWIPALDGVEEKLEAGAQRRRRRLRPRRLDDPHGAGVPGLDVRRLRLPRRLDRAAPRAARPTPASADRVTFEVARPRTSRATATTSSASSTACTTWATRSAPPPRPRDARRRTGRG